MRHPVVFVSWEWVTAWMQSVGQDYRALILLVRAEDGSLRAILPLARARKRVEGMLLPATTLTFCSSLECYPDHLDLICEAQCDAAGVLDACWEFLSQQKLIGAVVSLPFLAADGALSRYVEERMRTGMRVEKTSEVLSPRVDLSPGYAAYLAAMSKKKRYNLTRERKILCEDRSAQLHRVTDESSLRQAIDDLFDLHAKRAEDKGMASTFQGGSIVRFHELLASSLGESLHLYQLRIDGRPIATIYGFVIGLEFSFYQAGFDPAWKKLSPGKVLISMVMEQLAQAGITSFDFLGGSDEYKQFWATDARSMNAFLAFPRSPAGYFHSFAYDIARTLRAARKRFRAWQSARAQPAKANESATAA
jgi:CelD/BcsL family acetyltransferase involved in cellulose biosynthesis